MKKILCLFVALLVVTGMAFAADGLPSRGNVQIMTSSPTTCTHVTTSPAYLYGISIKAKQAAGWVAIADSNSTGVSSAAAHWTAMQTYSNLKAIVSQATQYATTYVQYDPPIYCPRGIFFIEGYSGTLETGNGGDGTDAIVYYSNAGE